MAMISLIFDTLLIFIFYHIFALLIADSQRYEPKIMKTRRNREKREKKPLIFQFQTAISDEIGFLNFLRFIIFLYINSVIYLYSHERWSQ